MKAPAFRRALLKKVLAGDLISRPPERFCDDRQLNNAIAWLRGTPRDDATNTYFIIYDRNRAGQWRYKFVYDMPFNVIVEVIEGEW